MTAEPRDRFPLATLRAGLLAAAMAVAPACIGSAATAEPPRDEARDAEAAPDLREALRQFYVHALGEELGLSPQRAQEVAPKVRALLDAQRAGIRGVVAAGLAVRRAAGGASDPAAAVAAFEDSEREGRERAAGARQAVVDDLTPRQAARFLTFEGRFRERVRALLAGGGSSSGGASAGGPGGSLPPEGLDDPGPPPGGLAGDREGLRRTAMLLFVNDVREELGLDDAHALALIGPIEAVVQGRIDGQQERRRLLSQLRDGAADESATDAQLSELVKQVLAADRKAAEDAARSRRALLATLSPLDGAKYLVVEQRFFARARQLQAARGLRPPDGADEAGRPMGPRGLGPPRRFQRRFQR